MVMEGADVQTLIEDEELRRLRAMAEGSKPFKASGLWERLAALDLKEFMKLPPRERLAAGYYVAARRRRDALQETAEVKG
jgi:hypothetical protein